jgi:ubiquitin-activating enzyme E1
MSSGVTMLFSDFMNKKKMEERKAMRIVDVVESVTNTTINPAKTYLVLELIATNLASDEGEDVEIPYVRFRIH